METITQTSNEPTATYQGASVISWRGARTPGLESDSYEVVMPAVGFRSLGFDVPADVLYPDLGRASGSVIVSGDSANARAPVPLEGEVKIHGDLVVSDGVSAAMVFRDLYLRDDGVEVEESGDSENGNCTVRMALVDIRYFWSRRGELWGTYNVRLPDGQWQPGTVKAAEAGPNSTSSTTLRDAKDDQAYSLGEVFALIADALPGRPKIKQLPGAAAKTWPPDLVWRGTRPKEELERLCRAYGVTVSLTLDNELYFSDAAEPDPKPLQATPGAARRLGDVTLAEGSWRRRLRRTFRHVPETVRVIGAPVVREVRVDHLDPVGYRRDKDTHKIDRRRLVGWDEAAQSYGLLLSDLASYVLQPQHIRARYLLGRGVSDPEVAATEIDEWAFKMFRLPKHALGFLPILDARAETLIYDAQRKDQQASSSAPDDPVGDAVRRLPPLVEADTFEEHRDPPAAPPKTQAAPEDGGSFGVDEEAEAAAEAAAASDAYAHPKFTADKPAQGAFQQLRDLAKIARRDFPVAFKNVDYAPRDDFKIDYKMGIVRFTKPVGMLVVDDTLKAAEMGKIDVGYIRVRITFAYNDSAAAADSLRQVYRIQMGKGVPDGGAARALAGSIRGPKEATYNFTALYGKPGQGEGSDPKILNPGLVEPDADKRGFPATVHEDSLRLFVSLADVDNRPALDRRAKEIARPLLFADRERWGEEGEAAALVPILPSSRISRVEWTGGPDGVMTKWSIENVAASKRNLGAKLADLGDVDRRDRRALDRVIGREP